MEIIFLEDLQFSLIETCAPKWIYIGQYGHTVNIGKLRKNMSKIEIS